LIKTLQAGYRVNNPLYGFAFFAIHGLQPVGLAQRSITAAQETMGTLEWKALQPQKMPKNLVFLPQYD